MSFDSQYFPPVDVAANRVAVTLGDLRFYPGRYLLTAWVGDAITHETFDELPNVAGFDVIDAGRLVNRKLSSESGLILMTPSWTAVD